MKEFDKLINKFEESRRRCHDKRVSYSTVLKHMKDARKEIDIQFKAETEYSKKVYAELLELKKSTQKEYTDLHKKFEKLAIDYIVLKYGVILK